MVVAKPIIIRNDGNKVKIIEQLVRSVQKNYVTVESKKGKLYNVNLSDIVKMTMNIQVGDMVEIKTFENGWLVTNVIPKREETLSEEEEKAELERQLKECEDMGYDY